MIPSSGVPIADKTYNSGILSKGIFYIWELLTYSYFNFILPSQASSYNGVSLKPNDYNFDASEISNFSIKVPLAQRTCKF